MGGAASSLKLTELSSLSFVLVGMERQDRIQLIPALSIYEVRGQRVMLDADLAEIYGTTTKRLNQQVRRNLERFPPDFMFGISFKELQNLRSQNVTSSLRHGGLRFLPSAFTEHGAIMLANVLKTPRAAAASIAIARAFVRLRAEFASHRELAAKINELESTVGSHDRHIRRIFEALHQLTEQPATPRSKIGFQPGEEPGREEL